MDQPSVTREVADDLVEDGAKAVVLAARRRILYGSENHLWDLVSDAMAEAWRSPRR